MIRKIIFKDLVRYSLILIVIQLILILLYFVSAGSFLTIQDDPVKADAIIVLGGDSCDYHRTKHAILLLDEGFAPRILFCGNGKALKDVVDFAAGTGLDTDCYSIVDSCYTTYDEGVAVDGIVESRPWESLIVVTDLYHSRRAVQTFKKMIKQAHIYSSPAFNTNYSRDRWWSTEAGLTDVFTETIKIVYYGFKYRISPI